jgi:BRCT domain type II-containing protein
MLSQKVLMIMAKHEIAVIPGMSEKQAWDAVYYKTKKSVKPRSAVSICFTGFTAEIGKTLKDTAIDRGWSVNVSVAKSTTHLCCGENAGPKKIETARSQGVKIISREDFEHMMETGEIL